MYNHIHNAEIATLTVLYDKCTNVMKTVSSAQMSQVHAQSTSAQGYWCETQVQQVFQGQFKLMCMAKNRFT